MAGQVMENRPEYSAGTTQANLAAAIESTPPYINRLVRKNDVVVNKTFVKMLEELGYDIELNYVKREVDGNG